MRTLLINCPYPASEHHSIPMGLAYIAAVLEKEGIEVQVQDFLVSTYSTEKSDRKIASRTKRRLSKWGQLHTWKPNSPM